MTSTEAEAAGASPRLTISGLAQRSGVPAATLRTWESRYGAPRPRRLASGHRRYDESAVQLVKEIVRLRTSGLGLAAAIAEASRGLAEPPPALFSTLRARHRSLQPRVLRKRSLLAVTRAVEDECCAHARRPLLFAAFQQEEFYWQSHQRWAELARTASVAVAFADFAQTSVQDAPMRLRLPTTSPLLREWLLVCDSPDRPACVAGWELPGQQASAPSERRFETLWTVDARVVRDASRICAGLAVGLAPGIEGRFGDRVAQTSPAASADLESSERLFARIVSYLDES